SNDIRLSSKRTAPPSHWHSPLSGFSAYRGDHTIQGTEGPPQTGRLTLSLFTRPDGAAAGDREKMISRVPLVHDVRDVDFHQPISKKSRLLNLGPPLLPDEEMAESTESAHTEDSLDYSSDGSSPSSSTYVRSSASYEAARLHENMARRTSYRLPTGIISNLFLQLSTHRKERQAALQR
ncbi:hypothetical protein PCASD_21188, partial [Puccinia coronata f. sp. avenae]